ncbi:hypothetical protein [Glutamicibacter nicotianae]|uniref:hypothetical protein n=1 Tax=Glutamicibacter nicotianae TaxID=37929 RepID=UPI00195AB0F3|nr:hypothetical protein [Glutamicibacter nicotianae]MBM7768240.1 putative nucleic acid-binding Zn ribbon protein [Glutamicibacter nicotianae]
MIHQDAEDLRALGERASFLPLKYQAENAQLKQELVDLYKREMKLLKIIDKRDEQLAQVTSGKSIKLPIKKKQVSRPADRKEIARLNSDLEYLQKRYEALKNSKLGRLQLWYWRKKAGN